MRVLVAGASGFVGSRLSRILATEGHEVVAIGRTLPRLPVGERITPRRVDAGSRDDLIEAASGCEAAYYLIHSLDSEHGFAEEDLRLARSFAEAMRTAGVARIIYLGGLGSGDLSEHLRSRQEVGEALGSSGLEVVEIRAAVIIGSGSISFEMMRYLVERLPVMVCPRWVRTKIQPVSIKEILSYLVASLQVQPGVYEIGGAPTSYREMMQTYASVRGLKRRLILDVPLLSLKLSSYWVDLVTPVDKRVSHSLIESLAVPVLVSDPSAGREFDVSAIPLPEALAQALENQAREIDDGLTERARGLSDGVYVIRRRAKLDAATRRAATEDLATIGGDIGWYGIAHAWKLRLLLGRLIGEDSKIARPETLGAGADTDWWRITHWDGSRLVLRAQGWRTGEGWLGFHVTDQGLELSAAFRPKGLPGWLYWILLGPIHRWAFAAMLRHRIRQARRLLRRDRGKAQS